jgi:hypothetical protein
MPIPLCPSHLGSGLPFKAEREPHALSEEVSKTAEDAFTQIADNVECPSDGVTGKSCHTSGRIPDVSSKECSDKAADTVTYAISQAPECVSAYPSAIAEAAANTVESLPEERRWLRLGLPIRGPSRRIISGASVHVACLSCLVKILTTIVTDTMRHISILPTLFFSLLQTNPE